MSRSTTTSIPSTDHYLQPTTPPAFLRRIIINNLLRRGFEGAEAGALAEIERLLERHITNVLEDSRDYAQLANRRETNAFDVLLSQEDSGWSSRSLRKEGKRRRRGPEIEFIPSLPEPPPKETFSSLLASDAEASRRMKNEEEDRKPDLSSAVGSRPPLSVSTTTGIRPEYAFDGAPDLPEKWTYVRDIPTENQEEKPTMENQSQPVKVTSALLDFIKLTATERGDIPPELGVVNYRRVDRSSGEDAITGSGGGQGGKRRRWGVKGVGAA